LASNVIVVDYHHIDKSVWNNFADLSPDTWLFHRTELIDLSELLGQQNLSFGIMENDQLVFICPTFLNTRKVLRNLLSLTVFSSGLGAAGPAFAPGFSERKKLRIWNTASDYLTHLARRHHALCFDFVHAPLSDRALPPQRDFINPFAMFGLCHGRMYGFDSCLSYPDIDTLIDLRKDTEAILQSMSRTCRRYSTTKAKQNGLIFSVNPDNSTAEFVRIHRQTFARTGAAQVNPGLFSYIEREILPRGFGDYFFAGDSGGRPIACLMVFTYKQRATPYVGGFLEEFHDLEPNYFLHWQTIQHYKHQNYRYYEIGPYFPYLSRNLKMFGIGDFKRKFGGTKMDLWRGTLVFHETKYLLLFGLLGILNGRRYKKQPSETGGE
jgi:hypothetical protein